MDTANAELRAQNNGGEAAVLRSEFRVPSSALTDSPWFWLLLFSSFALAALVTLGPKYAMRQGGIETKFQNRETALAWEGQEINSPAAVEATRLPRSPGQRKLTISLRPLLLGLGSLVTLGLIAVSLVQLRQGRKRVFEGSHQETVQVSQLP